MIRKGRATSDDELRVARLTTVGIGVVGILLAFFVEDKNIVFLAGLVYSLAESTNFPVLMLALGWRRFSTAGAVAGIATGAITSLALIALGPDVWPGDDSPFGLSNPAIVSVPREPVRA